MTIAAVVSIFEPLLFLHVFTTAQIRDHNAFDADTAVGKDLIMSMNPSSIKVNVTKSQRERKYEIQIILAMILRAPTRWALWLRYFAS